MGERFASVWDGLRDATEALASKKGFTLARTVNGYRLTGHGRTIHTGQLEDAAKVMRKADKSPVAALAGAACTIGLDSPANALQAVFVALSIVSTNWTDDTENATHAGCIESNC